ncbi:MAG TPA: adenylate/guanylate cyclase domain-containing protein, partial [Longimicrobiales bacterium]
MSSLPAVEGFSSTTLVVLVSDVAGYARVFRTRSGAEVAAFLDRLYRASERTIAERGGRIIKFMGDAVLAVFPPRDVRNAVAAAVTLEALVPRLAEELELALEIGASIHMGSVVEAELGEGAGRRTDVIGRTVNQTFLMGRGPGIRISEPVYRKL